MGLIKAAIDAAGGTFADQWKDFYTVPEGIAPTAGIFAAVPRGTNAGRGQNTKGSEDIITNGTKIVVPEGYGLILLEQGAINQDDIDRFVITDDPAVVVATLRPVAERLGVATA